VQLLKNAKPNILVIGDLMIDHYLWGDAERISPEAPVQIVDIARETSVLGGAGNVVNNLISLVQRSMSPASSVMTRSPKSWRSCSNPSG